MYIKDRDDDLANQCEFPIAQYVHSFVLICVCILSMFTYCRELSTVAEVSHTVCAPYLIVFVHVFTHSRQKHQVMLSSYQPGMFTMQPLCQ